MTTRLPAGRPLRFGVAISPSARPGADPVARAVEAERLGFDLVTAWDHLHGSVPTYETWTLLAWIAAATSRIGFGPSVLGLPYRAPPVVAKMAESLDRLSGGRLVLGIGGGGSDEEAAAFGLEVRPPGRKVEAQAEAIEVIRRLWAGETVTFDGTEFRLQGARIEPKAARHIPIWLGAYGPRALALTGRVADGWIPSSSYLSPGEYPGRRDIVLRAAEAAGRDPAGIEFAYNVSVRVVGRGEPLPTERPGVIAGTPEAVVEGLVDIVAMGVTHPVFWLQGDAREQQALLAAEVLPSLRPAG